MKTFLSSSPLLSPPNAFMVFRLPSGEIALAGTSWFSIELYDHIVTASIQKPEKADGWVAPEEFGLNLLPKDFSPNLSSSFPYFQHNAPLPEIPQVLGRLVHGEIPSLAACSHALICRKGNYYTKFNQLIVSATITEVFIRGKKEASFPEERFWESFPLGA